MAHELTTADLAELHAALNALAAQLDVEMNDAREGARPVDLDLPIGRVSRIDAIAVQQMAREARRRKRDRLAAVQAALQRMGRDDYGWCLRCDEPIGLARLRLRPESPTCVRCG